MPKHPPPKKAAALKYELTDPAPKVIAAGQGYVAEKIIQTAQDRDIRIIEDKELVEVLTKVNIGDSIPPELYDVVAKILVFIDNLDKAKGESKYADLKPQN
jgi:flagellar biosynthesis protein